MKVTIPLPSRSSPCIVSLPRSILEIEECRKIDISVILQKRLKYLLNSIYGILIGDTKEPEKRRKLIRLYTKERGELIRILALTICAKHLLHMQELESYAFRLRKYNIEQEQLADSLVYKCNRLKVRASSSYDIDRAVNVLFRKKAEFPSSVLEMAQSLSGKIEKKTDFSRVEQMIVIYIQRSGIWQNKNVKHTVKEGMLILDSFGFRSTLAPLPGVDGLHWYIISIVSTEYEGKSISAKCIKGNNPLKEIIHATKYVKTLLDAEELFRTIKEIADKGMFEIEILGRSKEFTCTILGIYKVEVKITKNWNGPSLVCTFQCTGTRKVCKENILVFISEEINRHIKKSYGEQSAFFFERGLVYDDHAVRSIREMQKEHQLAVIQKKAISVENLLVKENFSILFQGVIHYSNIFFRDSSGEFVALLWSSMQSTVKIFYGMHRHGSIPLSKMLPVNSEDSNCLFSVHTDISAKKIIEIFKYNAKHLLVLIAAARSIWEMRKKAIIYITDCIRLVCGAVEIKIEQQRDKREIVKIRSPVINLCQKMQKTQAVDIFWFAVLVDEITNGKHYFLPSEYANVKISGRIDKSFEENDLNNGLSATDTIILQKDMISIEVICMDGSIICKSKMPLLREWTNSAIRSHSLYGLISIYSNYNILASKRLLSTVSVHGTLGGCLEKTCQTSIVYTVGRYINVFWIKKSYRIIEAFSAIPKMKETETEIVLDIEYLSVFLEIIENLLSKERFAWLGNEIIIRDKEKEARYSITCNRRLVCTQTHGDKIFPTVPSIIESEVDIERSLLEQDLYMILPN